MAETAMAPPRGEVRMSPPCDVAVTSMSGRRRSRPPATLRMPESGLVNEPQRFTRKRIFA